MSDNERQAHYDASHQRTLGKYKERIERDYVRPTLEEFKEKLINISPVYIWNSMYSDNKHLYEVTKLMTTSTITMFCTAWADKTPQEFTWDEFYNELKNGMQYIRF